MAKVLQFPVREATTRLVVNETPTPMFAVWRCAGCRDAFVSAPLALCLSCAAREVPDAPA